MVQWNHACFGVQGVSKRTGSNPVHGPSVAAANTFVSSSSAGSGWNSLPPLAQYRPSLVSAQGHHSALHYPSDLPPSRGSRPSSDPSSTSMPTIALPTSPNPRTLSAKSEGVPHHLPPISATR
ncbi:hypothetical protein E2C01_009747 [Portunus trituberculatus]|uniref:Uncharacterized protein n=1 Tax=Portunus trituberculatus TaxID=210409 RepID=A0A5B7D6K6_PORTR|nr:hypothetical protein [Portunus trituberculatus]